MTDNKSNSSNASMISFSKGFNPKETLVLLSSRKGMVWKSKETKKDIILRSPLLEVVYPPTPAPGRNIEYSMALRVHVGENSSTALKHEQMFKELSESAYENAVNFMMVEKNGKLYAKKTFENPDKFKVTKFWYDDGKFYMRFRTSVSAHLFDAEETKKMKESGSNKKVYHSIRDDVRRYLGAKSLISVDFRPSAFFYQKKNTLYPFSLNIEKIVIWAYNENKNPDSTQRSTKKHGFLKGFALDIPLGYKLPEEIEQQTDVPVNHVNTFNGEKYSLSRVIDGAKGPVIYARDGDSFGPTYYKADNVVVKWDITADPEWNSRSIVLADCKANAAVLKMVREQFSKLVDTVTENSEKILGDKYERETVEELISNPLYSQKDVEKANARVSLKLPREEKSDKPLFELFTLPDDEDDSNGDELKTLVPIDMGDTCDEAEKVVGAGTVCRSLVFMTRPVIVNSQVYLSGRVEQILVDPNQARVFTPRLNGFPFPGYEDVDIERSNTNVVSFTGKNFHFTNYDDKRKSFSLLFEGKDGKTSEYGVLPYPVTVAFDIGLVNDPDNNQFAYRIRYNHTNEDLLSMIRGIDAAAVEHCTKNSKDIFGAKKNSKVVAASLNKGKLEKYSKNDKEKKEPYSTMKAGVYEKNGGYNIDFVAFRLVNPVDEDGKVDIHPIPINQPEDLMEVFHSDATVLPIVRIRGTFVDKRIILSTTVAASLLVPTSVESDIPFADAAGDDMLSLSTAAQEEINKAAAEQEEKEEKESLNGSSSDSPAEVKEPVKEEVEEEKVEDVPEPSETKQAGDAEESDNEPSENEESDDESEEEEEEEESD